MKNHGKEAAFEPETKSAPAIEKRIGPAREGKVTVMTSKAPNNKREIPTA